MKPQLSIVKIGGNIIESPEELSEFLSLFAALPNPKVLVHGGGKRASQIESKLGLTPRLHQGRRITDNDSLDVVVMVYAGLLNKNVVAHLQALQCNAIGMSGADANSILSVKRPVKDIDYGWAGDVVEVNHRAIDKLLKADLVPVFCALTHDGKGQLLNTNADTIASELAIGLSSRYQATLYYCFEKKGVLRNVDDENSVIRDIDEAAYLKLKAEGVIADGMLPKLDNCFHALYKDVSRVCIGDKEMLRKNASNYTTIQL
ncbi:acetylglutamate kinase [Zeaxanthinibacter enoshimensis]|uniref:acetylglutamate kinase n=1 Tax=Zeaxanthinibacter enoshimensis TaxID=392009 RepID=UPI0035693C54